MAEQASIAYHFQAFNAEEILKAMREIDRTTKEGKKRFGEFESAAQSLSRQFGKVGKTAREVADGIRDIPATAVDAQSDAWKKLQEEISATNAQYKLYKQSLVTRVGGVEEPQLSREDLDTYVAQRKAANADIVTDHERTVAAEKRESEAALKAELDNIQRSERAKEQSRQRELQSIEAGEKAKREEFERTLSEALDAEQRRQKAMQASRQRELQSIDDREKAMAKLDSEVEKQSARASKFAEQIDYKKQADEIGSVEAANKRLSNALEEQVRAERDLQRVRSQSSGSLDDKKEEVRATRELADANQEVASAMRNVDSANNGLISQRYALYDLATTYTTIGTALAGMGIYATVVGAQFESAFTNVERTLDPAEGAAYGISRIKQELIGLSGQIPLTFQELSQIATIGNQMGIAADDLMGFTSTVARFASVSGMTVDAVTQAFGGVAAQTGLASEYFENLGSSIALVGRESNATEEQLISVIREVAAGGAAAGLAIDEIVGLAGALASLQVPPERARGAIDMYFGRINKAVAEGGPQLQTWATLLGKTTGEIENMVRAGQGAELMQDFLGALQGLDNVDLGKIFGELDTDALRLANTLQRLGQNAELLPKYLGLAQSGFLEGAELNRQYEMTLQDLNSQWIIFINGVNAVIEAISGGAVPSLAGLLMMVNNVVFAFREFLDRNPWAAKALTIAGAIVTVVGVMALLRGATLAVQASLLAYRYLAAQATQINVPLTATLGQASRAFFGVEAGATRATFALRVFRLALIGTGIGIGIAAIGAVAEGFMSIGGSAKNATLGMDEYNQMVADMKSQNQTASKSSKALADSIGGPSGGGGGSPSVADAAKSAAEEIRTLVDYAQDLAGVFSRSYELRFSSQSAMDTVTLKWIELNEQIAEYERKVRSLTADRSLKAYWLSVAELYNDQLRAGQLREEIAKIDDDLAEANAGASRELVGNSRAAIENRQTMAGLVDGYEDYIVALAKSGASQEFIQQEIKRLNSEFVDQATQLGYNVAEIDKYAIAFNDFSTIVSNVPRNVSIEFNSDPALTALAEFAAQVKKDAAAAGSGAVGGFGDGFGGGLDAAMPDDIPWPDYGLGGDGDKVGTTFAQDIWNGLTEWWDGLTEGGRFVIRLLSPIWAGGWLLFTEEGKTAAKNFFNGVGEFFGQMTPQQWFNAIAQKLGFISGSMVTSGKEIADDIFTGIGDFFRNVTSTSWWTAITVKLGISASDFVESGKKLAGEMWTGVKALFSGLSAQDWVDAITRGMSAIGDKLWTIGNQLFGSFWRGFSAGTGGSGSAVDKVLNKAINGSFANGGYTGAGAKYQPAGIVHRGEYVIPKQYVNQRTGLPDMSYVASLNNSKAAPKTSYATGGLVTGGMSGPVELGNYTLDRLARSVAVELRVGQQQLARATSDGNTRLAQRGSN